MSSVTGMFRARTGRLVLLLAATTSMASLLTACASSDNAEETAVQRKGPAGASTTQPSSIVKPSGVNRPWEAGNAVPHNAKRVSEPVERPEAATAPPINADVPREEQTTRGGVNCDVSIIAEEVGERKSADQMRLDFCNGQWAHVSLSNSGISNWAVYSDGHWLWLPASGRTSGPGPRVNCYSASDLEAHAPVPQKVTESLAVCGPDDSRFEDVER